MKVLVILNLCITFTILSYLAIEPFVTEHLTKESALSTIHHVMGSIDNDSAPRNQERFAALSSAKQKAIQQKKITLLAPSHPSFSEKLSLIFDSIVFNTNPLLVLWITLSVLTSVLLLLHISGAQEASWLLLVTCILLFFSYSAYSPPQSLWPSEETLLTEYPMEKEGASLREQLFYAWDLYLVDHYLTTGFEENSQEEKLEEAQYQFHLALALEPLKTKGTPSAPSILLFALFALWNVTYPTTLLRISRRQRAAAL